MNTRQKHNYPARLEGLRRRFERWRQSHRARSRIADPLWAAAVNMADAYGIHLTARALRLNYYALKKRVEQRSVAAPGLLEEGATFIELPPPVSVDSCKGGSGPCECTLELEDAGGAKLRVHLQGIAAPDLAALCRSFRSCPS
jgi:hypothetical protein